MRDTDVVSNIIDHYYDEDYQFSASDNDFFIAAAITAFDSAELTDDPRYGELVIEHYGWGNEEIGIEYGFNPIRYH